MRFQMIPLFIIVFTNIAIDIWLYYKLKKNFKSKLPSRIHLVISILLLIYIITATLLPHRTIGNEGLVIIMWMLYSYLTIYIPKYLFSIIYFISLIPKLWNGKPIPYLPSVGLGVSVLTFGMMWWGALVTINQTNVIESDVYFKNLPKSFEGYRIVQFSDFHLGTYGNDTSFVSKAINEINGLNPDMIIFTGDIVNRNTKEVYPFIKILSRLKAKDGVYSILGNHDYGDYMTWSSEAEKKANNEELFALQKQFGWDLLRNENRIIKEGNDSIALIGVENWGDPPFKTYGDLHKSYSNLNDSTFKILLSHNPSHWRAEIIDQTNIDLMFAGHTHAMQTMIKVGDFSFSPAEWRYKEWGGLYEEKDQQLYVNIGLGQIAMPFRLGAVPEISLITLRKEK